MTQGRYERVNMRGFLSLFSVAVIALEIEDMDS